ncbi:MAG: hypothetical protein WCC86_03955, partial [Methanoregula sp.]
MIHQAEILERPVCRSLLRLLDTIAASFAKNFVIEKNLVREDRLMVWPGAVFLTVEWRRFEEFLEMFLQNADCIAFWVIFVEGFCHESIDEISDII